MKTGAFNLLQQDRVVFGIPAADALHTEATQRAARRIFVVTSRSLKHNRPVASDARLPIAP